MSIENFTTVSDLASYCAHCGHIEPSNLEDFNESDCTIGLLFVHKYDCAAMNDDVSHNMFVALWNARTHMEANDVLLRRACESIDSAMKPFSDKHLNENSHYIKCTTNYDR